MNARDEQAEPQHWHTTYLVQRARNGDAASLDEMVARLSPLLLAIAEYRLGPGLRVDVDPEDIVNEAWLITLPRLGELRERDGRITPVLLKFLTTTISNLISNLLRRRIVGRPDGTRGTAGTGGSESASRVPAEASGAITRAMRNETREAVRAAIDELPEQDREILLLRGIEQNSSRTVATLLGLSVAAVDKRYSRAVARLRQRLPESVFWELDEPQVDDDPA